MVLKRIFLILILPIFIYAQWTDPRPRSVQLWHMAEGVIDSLTVSAFYVDTLEAKETTLSEDVGGLIRLNGLASGSNYGAGLFLITNTSYTPDGANVIDLNSGSNQLVRITEPIVEDTLKLKNLPPLWQTVNLKQLSSSNTNGGGMFVYADSVYPEGVVAFASAAPGKQFKRDIAQGILSSWASGDAAGYQRLINAAVAVKQKIKNEGEMILASRVVLGDSLLIEGGRLVVGLTDTMFVAETALDSITFKDVHFIGRSAGYILRSSQNINNLTFENCVFDSLTQTAIDIKGANTKIKFKDCKFYYHGTGNGIVGIGVANVTGLDIVNCDFEGGATVSLNGEQVDVKVNNSRFKNIKLQTALIVRGSLAGGDTLRNIRITNNTFENTSYGGAKGCISVSAFESGTPDTCFIEQVKIQGNTAKHTDRFLTMDLSRSKTYNVDISNNQIDGSFGLGLNGVPDSIFAANAIYIIGSSKGTPNIAGREINIKNNQIRHIRGTAIFATAYDFDISNNIIHNAGTDTTAFGTNEQFLAGIAVVDGAKGKISGNEISSCNSVDVSSSRRGSGIFYQTSDTLWIYGNVLQDNYYGINNYRFASATEVPVNINITNNHFLNNTQDMAGSTAAGDSLSNYAIAISTGDDSTVFARDTHVILDNYFNPLEKHLTTNASWVYYDNDRVFTNRDASSGVTITLSKNRIGSEVEVVKIANQTLRIDPNVADQIRGSSAAGKYLELDNVGDRVRLKCINRGFWEVTNFFASADTLHFEP